MATRLVAALLLLATAAFATPDGYGGADVANSSLVARGIAHHEEVHKALKQLLPPPQEGMAATVAPPVLPPVRVPTPKPIPPPTSVSAVSATSVTSKPPPPPRAVPVRAPVPSPPTSVSAVSATSVEQPPPPAVVQRPAAPPTVPVRPPATVVTAPVAVPTAGDRCVRRNATPAGPARPCTLTVAQEIGRLPELSTLLAAVQAAGLAGALSAEGTAYTIFAPTNEAFAKFIASRNTTAAALLADTSTLATVLKYHVVATRALLACQVVGPAQLTTLQGETLSVDVRLPQGTLVITGRRSSAVGVRQDIRACRNVIQEIDNVLLP
jgi:uncharacterized surface protein with fasciclin (FAS1) repeats